MEGDAGWNGNACPAGGVPAGHRPIGRVHPPVWPPDAKEALLAHGWPGNVRELRNALERASILCEGG